MVICRWPGYLDLFITFACNAKWPEIELFLSRKLGQKIEDWPDVVARVFKIKLDQLLNNLKHGQHFGRVTASTLWKSDFLFLLVFIITLY